MPVAALSVFKFSWIQVFGHVWEHQSQSAAARVLKCDQGTISRTLAELDEFLGGKVFEGTRKQALTPLGEAFLPRAAAMIKLAHECKGLNADLVAQASQPKPASGTRAHGRRLLKLLGLGSGD